MIVEQIWTANAYRNFNYLIACPETGEALAVDPLVMVHDDVNRKWIVASRLFENIHAMQWNLLDDLALQRVQRGALVQ